MESGKWSEVPLTAITIGPRFRKDLGDIAALAESIACIGLLHPIIVTPDYQLVVGRRRLEAHKRLGRTTIEAQVVDLNDPFGAEVDENEHRKAYTPSERVGIGEAREARDKEQARQRQRQHARTAPGKKKNTSENFTEVSEQPQARDITAAAVGMSWPTYQKAKAVVEAAKEEPEFQELVEAMDRTGNVTRAYNKLPLYMRENPADEDVPRPRKPPRPMTVGTMQMKLDAVVMGIIMPRLYQLDDHHVAHLYKLLDFYRELIAQERADLDATADRSGCPILHDRHQGKEGAPPPSVPLTAPEEEPAPQPQGLLCLWCGGKFSMEEDEIRHRAQCRGYMPTTAPEASSTKRRQGSALEPPLDASQGMHGATRPLRMPQDQRSRPGAGEDTPLGASSPRAQDR